MNELIIYTDGSSRRVGNEWLGAYALTAFCNEKAVYQVATRINPATISEAELVAVMNAAYYAKFYHPTKKVTIRSDSEYVVKGLNGINRIHKHKGLWAVAKRLTEGMTIEHVKGHGSSNENNHVDYLAYNKLKQGLN